MYISSVHNKEEVNDLSDRWNEYLVIGGIRDEIGAQTVSNTLHVSLDVVRNYARLIGCYKLNGNNVKIIGYKWRSKCVDVEVVKKDVCREPLVGGTKLVFKTVKDIEDITSTEAEAMIEEDRIEELQWGLSGKGGGRMGDVYSAKKMSVKDGNQETDSMAEELINKHNRL